MIQQIINIYYVLVYIGIIDGMDYVEDCFNAEECKLIFKMFFEEMGQKQHYDMMIRLGD